MGLYEDQLLPRVIDRLLDTPEHRRMRRRVAAPLSGVVLEVGFGSGLNVPHYPGGVERVYAVDPATVGRRLAAERLEEAGVEVEFVGLDGESIPLGADTVDAVLTTFTLCTIPQVDRALDEMRRVLRPGGTVHFVEHGRHEHPRVVRWQDRLNPVQRFVAGGCNLNRAMDELIADAGFELESLENYEMTGPRVLTYVYEGVARKPSAAPAT